MRPLIDISSGKKVKVCAIECGMGLMNRLCSVGINRGQELEVIKNESGPIIIKVLNSRFILGRGQARKIMVKEC